MCKCQSKFYNLNLALTTKFDLVLILKTKLMPWTKKKYPDAMKNLPVKTRNKAIEIANAILKDGKLDEGAAIATGISKAKETIENNSDKKEK